MGSDSAVQGSAVLFNFLLYHLLEADKKTELIAEQIIILQAETGVTLTAALYYSEAQATRIFLEKK